MKATTAGSVREALALVGLERVLATRDAEFEREGLGGLELEVEALEYVAEEGAQELHVSPAARDRA